MKKIPLLLSLVILSGCVTSQKTIEVPENVNLPQKVLFLAQSGTTTSLFQTVIDLENNELVVLEYFASTLYRVYRTGLIVDPNDYKNYQISSTDAPFETPEIPASDTSSGGSSGSY